MEKEQITQADYLRYDRVWQRVAPELDPYPQVRQAAAEERSVPAGEDTAAAQVAALAARALEDRRLYLRQLRRAPAAAGKALHRLAEEEGAHARRLMGLYYILTGQCCSPVLPPPGAVQPWCPFLRRRYGEECAAVRELRAAAETAADGCLQGIFLRLAQDHCRHAETLLRLLEGNLPGRLA